MDQQDWLAERFEQHRPRLRAVSYRMLGSLSEADDAVQEAWLRFSGADTSAVEDLGAWLTTVVARICLNALRSRKARPEEPIDPHLPDPIVSAVGAVNPEDEALVADSVGLALLIVLDSLAPAERLAFVLHDVFDVPFEQVAPIVDRSEAATRQLASRARRRLRTTGTSDLDIAKQWELVDAFLAAARDGDFDALLKVLDPDVVRRVDAGATLPGVPPILRGARAVASGAVSFQKLGYVGRRALVNGGPGVVSFAGDKPLSVVGFTIAGGKIVEMNILTDPARLRQLDLAVLAP
ncbi:MAG TPA: sigma-70 family RNA polymerase sigma factor [Solirubrobacteraceae bacterium]|nr:sigma-70 family RNA polymerase sigma factor [Solirubrobacteraceae bacterium]